MGTGRGRFDENISGHMAESIWLYPTRFDPRLAALPSVACYPLTALSVLYNEIRIWSDVYGRARNIKVDLFFVSAECGAFWTLHLVQIDPQPLDCDSVQNSHYNPLCRAPHTGLMPL